MLLPLLDNIINIDSINIGKGRIKPQVPGTKVVFCMQNVKTVPGTFEEHAFFWQPPGFSAMLLMDQIPCVRRVKSAQSWGNDGSPALWEIASTRRKYHVHRRPYMKESHGALQGDMGLPRLLALIFIPTALATAAYVLAGLVQQAIPSLLLFFLVATLILFPIELGVVLRASKRYFGSYSLRSAFANHKHMPWWKVLAYAVVLFGYAGLMSAAIGPLERMVAAPLADKLYSNIPAYFNWDNLEYLRNYPKGVLLITCIAFLAFNVVVGPVVEELFFRGYLTSRIGRFGKWSPVIVTVLFSLYHLWLPFNNLFRTLVFLPAAYVAWRQKNIYIAIVFHCLCNLISTIGFIVALYAV